MSPRVFALIVATLAPQVALAQAWQAPAAAVVRLGVQAMACQGEFCLGVGCRFGRAELISISPGGGPFNGAAAVEVGARKARVVFTVDPAFMTELGVLGTRATVEASVLPALAQARTIAVSGSTFSEKRLARFALSGFARHAPKVIAACGVLE